MTGAGDDRWRASLSAEDAELWDWVTHDVDPVYGKPRVRIRGAAVQAAASRNAAATDQTAEQSQPDRDQIAEQWQRYWALQDGSPIAKQPSKRAATVELHQLKSGPTPASRQPPAPEPVRPVLLERRKSRRIARGAEEIEARLDLHGLTQDEAYRSLSIFLRRCHTDGARTVIVITGKGGAGGPARNDRGAGSYDGGDRETRERGVLRRLMPLWLDSDSLRPIVIGFSAAHLRHGGGGALYVMLRRGR